MKKNDLKTLATVLGSMGLGLAMTKKVKDSNLHRRIQGSFNKQQIGKPRFNPQALYKQSGHPYVPILGTSSHASWQASAKVNTYRVWETAARQAYPTGDMLVIALREAYQNSIDAINAAIKAGQITRGYFSVHVSEYSNNSVSIEFTDNGIGMDKDTIVNSFLSLGDTGKEEGIGGFGYAKAAILFASGSFSFSIRTRDVLFINESWEKPGVGSTVLASEDWGGASVSNYRQGTTLTIANIKMDYAGERSSLNLGEIAQSKTHLGLTSSLFRLLERFQQVLRMNTEPDNIDVTFTFEGYTDGDNELIEKYGDKQGRERRGYLLYTNKRFAADLIQPQFSKDTWGVHGDFYTSKISNIHESELLSQAQEQYTPDEDDTISRQDITFKGETIYYQQGPAFPDDAGSALMITGQATPNEQIIDFYEDCKARIRLFGRDSLPTGFFFRGYVVRLGSGSGDRQVQFVVREENEMFPGIVVLDLFPEMRPTDYEYPLTNSRMDFKHRAADVFYNMTKAFRRNIERMDYTFDKRLLVPTIIPMAPNVFVDHKVNDPMILDGLGLSSLVPDYFDVRPPGYPLQDFAYNFFKKGEKERRGSDIDCTLPSEDRGLPVPFVRNTYNVLRDYYLFKDARKWKSNFKDIGLNHFNPSSPGSLSGYPSGQALYNSLSTDKARKTLEFWYGVSVLMSDPSREGHNKAKPYLEWGNSFLPFDVTTEGFTSIDFLIATTQLFERNLAMPDRLKIWGVMVTYQMDWFQVFLFVELYMNEGPKGDMGFEDSLTRFQREEWLKHFDWTNPKLHKDILAYFAPTAYFRFQNMQGVKSDAAANFQKSKQRPTGYGSIETQTANGILMALAVPWLCVADDFAQFRQSRQQKQTDTVFTRKAQNKYNIDGRTEIVDVQRFAYVMNDIRSYSLRRGNTVADRGALYGLLLEHVQKTKELEKKLRRIYGIKSPTWKTYYDEDFSSGVYGTPFGTNCVVNVESDFEGFTPTTFNASTSFILPALTIFNNGMLLLIKSMYQSDPFDLHEKYGLPRMLIGSFREIPIVGITNDASVNGFNQGRLFDEPRIAGQIAINPSYYQQFRNKTKYCEELALIIMRLIVHEFSHYDARYHDEKFTQVDGALFNFAILNNLPYRLAYIIRSIDPSTSWRNMGSMSKEQIIHKQRQMAKKYTHATCPKCKG